MKKYPEQMRHGRHLADHSKRSVLSHTSTYLEDALQPGPQQTALRPWGNEGHKLKAWGTSSLRLAAKTLCNLIHVFSCKVSAPFVA